jgi:hypothetical protein
MKKKTPGADLETPAVEGPSLPDIGAALRKIARRLKRVESYTITCRLALDGQNTNQDSNIAVVLQRAVGDLLFEQIRDLENVAAKCDGGPPSERNDDDAFEDDREAAP